MKEKSEKKLIKQAKKASKRHGLKMMQLGFQILHENCINTTFCDYLHDLEQLKLMLEDYRETLKVKIDGLERDNPNRSRRFVIDEVVSDGDG